jgi:cephalosporin-C deacetylase-like acetyl esterase
MTPAAILRPPSWRTAVLLVASALSAWLPATELSVAADHADGQYQIGEAVTWTVTATGPVAADLAYTVKSGGLQEIAKGTLSFSDGKASVHSGLDHPGTLLLSISHDGKQSLGGAGVAWTKIEPSAPPPADFDAFWADKIAELQKVPANPQLTPVDSGNPAVSLSLITMDNIHGSKIHGYLARPVAEGPCPAMLVVQWAGVYALDKKWSVGPAANGWLVLNIIAHDLPVDQPKEFYDQQSAGPLKDYPSIGSDDRETMYFLRMYLSCYRAADYLSQRQDWNKATLLVQGGSQGGLQSLVTAGLHPAITAVTANVPAGCDHTGALVNREPGWPHLINSWNHKDAQKVTLAATYYDVVNFARRIRCPVLVGMGLIDTTCPPAGVFAMFDQIHSPKRILVMPQSGHMGPHDAYYPVMNSWWEAAKAGKTLPLQ